MVHSGLACVAGDEISVVSTTACMHEKIYYAAIQHCMVNHSRSARCSWNCGILVLLMGSQGDTTGTMGPTAGWCYGDMGLVAGWCSMGNAGSCN